MASEEIDPRPHIYWPSVEFLPIAGGRIIGFIPFPMVLVLCEMQSVSSRIWTRVVVSISYDDNHYTTGTDFTLVIVIQYNTLVIVIQYKLVNYYLCHKADTSYTWVFVNEYRSLACTSLSQGKGYICEAPSENQTHNSSNSPARLACWSLPTASCKHTCVCRVKRPWQVQVLAWHSENQTPKSSNSHTKLTHKPHSLLLYPNTTKTWVCVNEYSVLGKL